MYGDVKGIIKRVNIEQDETGISISYSVKNNNDTDLCVYAEDDLYATLGDAQLALEKKHDLEKDKIEVYIGKKK